MKKSDSFMSKFIDKIANYIVEENIPLNHLTLILPSQRAKKYLQRALFTVLQKPFFAPKMLTMNRWIHELTEKSVIETTRALFKLYEVHLEVDKDEPQSLDEFLKWGRILLSDFDEIDRYLIDSKDLFKNLADIKEIENWSFGDPEKLTEGQKRYMRFWDLLEEYYRVFNKRLEADNECYMGNAYKNVANNVRLAFENDKDSYFIFAGFNALSPAEISIMKQLQKMGRASIFVDGDSYYIDNKNHEAGRFIRDLYKELNVKSLPFINDGLRQDSKEINVINCVQLTGQAKVSATILSEQISVKELSETLLLLADESLVVPVIKNIPKSVGKTNITLGLPLNNTSVKSWVDLLFNVQENFYRFNSKRIYHKDFIRFIKHPFIINFCNSEELQELTEAEQKILNFNWTFIYVNKLQLSERLRKLLDLFFQPWNLQQGVFPLENIRNINRTIHEDLSAEKSAIEKSVIYHFDRSIARLEEVLAEFKPIISLGTFKSLFNQHWVNESVAYYGNPLDGLQVMGLLETRLIDFKNMIVVGLNDGSMPPTNPIQSMIMMDLRKYFQLPTPREKQGLFAHHFYRLFHTVEKCWITYSSSEAEGLKSSEPSRYIMQLQLELARTNPNISFNQYDYTLGNSEEKERLIRVKKTPDILRRLDAYFAHKTSASALKTSMKCPLDFYYKYLLGLGEEDKVEEEIQANTFGTFVHSTLQKLYSDFAQMDSQGNKLPNHKSVSFVDIQAMLTQQNDLMHQEFAEFFNLEENQQLEGKNYLSFEIARHLTHRFLKQEEKLLKQEKGHLFIIGLELELSKELTLTIQGQEKVVRFDGFLDRVDEVNGEVRVIDYKTGRCDEGQLLIPSVKNEEEKLDKLIGKLKSSNYLFQMLVYNMLFFEKFGKYPDKVGIVSMINLGEEPFYVANELTETTEELMELFKQAIEVIIEDLYNVAVDFEHDPASQYCGYCV